MTATDQSIASTEASVALRLNIDLIDILARPRGYRSAVAQAEAIGIDRSYWFDLRSGIQRNPSLRVLEGVARMCGTTIDALLVREGV